MADEPVVIETPQSHNPIDILDPALGGKIRAFIALLLALATAALAVLQSAGDLLQSFPQWRVVGAVAMFIQAAIQTLARFSTVGNKAVAQ